MSADGLWKEARHTDGRVYYWNTQTKETRWTKPEPSGGAESATASQAWKEYATPEGKKYYHNTETKATVWEMPEAYKTSLEQNNGVPSRPPTSQQSFVAGGAPNFQQYAPQRERDDFRSGGVDRPRDYGQPDHVRNNFVPATPNEPDYASFDDAEAAFMKLLKRCNVQPDWSWEDAMRATIKDPQYRAIKDPKDRKVAFEKYIAEARVQDKEKEKERMAKLRQDFTTMLKSHPEIKYYTRWKTARPIIEGETIFRSTGNDTERRQLFEEYVAELRKQHAENEVTQRKAALDELTSVLKALDLEPYTRWADAQEIINSSERFQSDDKFKTLSKSDVLNAFENHIKSLERTFNDSKQLQKNQKGRRERQNRDQFQVLLKELRGAEKIKAGTKWMDVLPLIEEDPRYIAMLGQPGSTPLDLFWDIVEEEERALRGKRNEVLDVLDDKRYEITPSTSLEEFMQVMQSDRRTSAVNSEDLKLIFSRLHDKIVRRSEEDKHHAERTQRRAIDALRSRIKHLDPPVRATDVWDDIRPRVEKSDEYRALETDDLRRSAFDKVVKRMKEKETDADQAERTKRSDRSERDRDGAGSRRRARGEAYSRTPEPDAYEADRRRAMAARERQYRKSSTSGLSPPPADSAHPRSRGTRERYEDRERHDRPRGYDRERKERELERERAYLSRADPRDGAAKELDYGESAGSMSGGTGRRRRESGDEGEPDDESGRRDSKRVRRERKSKTPEAVASAAATKDKEEEGGGEEEEAFKSGSEEGEIEEG